MKQTGENDSHLYSGNLGRSLKIITYLLTLWALTATTLVQVFPAIFIFALYGMILISWFREPSAKLWTRWVWNILTLIVLLFSFTQLFRDPILSIFFMLNYLAVNKIFNLASTRDYAQLIVVTFFQILFTSVLTSSITFAFLFCGYLVLLIFSLILLNCKRDYISSIKNDRPGMRADRKVPVPVSFMSKGKLRHFVKPLFGSVFFYWVVILIMMMQFFMVLPRIGDQHFLRGFLRIPQESRSGFSDRVSFAPGDTIEIDPSVVMRIQPLSSTEFNLASLEQIRIRGTALDTFDQSGWHLGKFAVDSAVVRGSREEAMLATPNPRRPHITQRVILEPNRSNYLFAIDMPFLYLFPGYRLPIIINTHAGYARLIQRLKTALTYEAHSFLTVTPDEIMTRKAKPSSALVTFERGAYQRQIYLDMPDDEYKDEIAKLAQDITEGAGLAVEKAKKIETYLQNNYEYTLEQGGSSYSNPVGAFLFETRRGHCELFSSAMCLMVRSLDIPSRLVIGYFTDEWNPYGEYFLVRESNAHAWVEIWIDGYGWVAFDPTPPQSLPLSPANRNVFARISHMYDSLRVKWYNYVIDFDYEYQRIITRYMIKKMFGFMALTNDVLDKVFSLRRPRPSSPIRMLAILMMVFFIIAGTFVLFQTTRSSKKTGSLLSRLALKKKRLSKPESMYISKLFMQIQEKLNQLGYSVERGETPLEFASDVVMKNARFSDFVPFTLLYYRLRYGNPELNEQDIEVIEGICKELDITCRFSGV